ncbi:hypothetical protein [Haloglycomyces albus]|uniref:hypothetical protein n=1 Tax=Haloglycomyces albus TaxID=526067 RepID=UPI0005564E85|nr:hypothetical protein [Haloglycomyces albus]
MDGSYSCYFCGSINHVAPQPCDTGCQNCGALKPAGGLGPPSIDPDWTWPESPVASVSQITYQCPYCRYRYASHTGSCPLCHEAKPSRPDTRILPTPSHHTPHSIDRTSAQKAIRWKSRPGLRATTAQLRATYLPYWLWSGSVRYRYTTRRGAVSWTKSTTIGRPRKTVSWRGEYGNTLLPLHHLYPATSAFRRLDLHRAVETTPPDLNDDEGTPYADRIYPDVVPHDAFVGLRDRFNRLVLDRLAVDDPNTITQDLDIDLSFPTLRCELVYLSFWSLCGTRTSRCLLVPAWETTSVAHSQ